MSVQQITATSISENETSVTYIYALCQNAPWSYTSAGGWIPLTAPPNDVDLIELAVSDDNTVIAGLDSSGNLWYSSLPTINWQQISSVTNAQAVGIGSSTEIFYTYSSETYTITDPSKSQSVKIADKAPTYIAAAENSDKRVFCIGASEDSTTVDQFRPEIGSTDKWTDEPDLPGLPSGAKPTDIAVALLSNGNLVAAVCAGTEIYYCWKQGSASSWCSWKDLSGVLTIPASSAQEIAIVPQGSGLQLIVLDTNGYIWQCSSSDLSKWTGWSMIAGLIPIGISITQNTATYTNPTNDPAVETNNNSLTVTVKGIGAFMYFTLTQATFNNPAVTWSGDSLTTTAYSNTVIMISDSNTNTSSQSIEYTFSFSVTSSTGTNLTFTLDPTIYNAGPSTGTGYD